MKNKMFKLFFFFLFITVHSFIPMSFADEPILDYKYQIGFSTYAWEINRKDTDTLIIYQDDIEEPFTQYSLSGCMFCSGEEDGCEQDGLSSVFLAKDTKEPLVLSVCHIGAHSRQLQVFAPLRNKTEAIFSTTGAYTIDYEKNALGVIVTTDYRNANNEFVQKTEYWPAESAPGYADSLPENLIYQLAENPDVSQLKEFLDLNPQAWDTGEDYLGDTPVGEAINSANLGALKLFVEHGYNLNPNRWFVHPIRMFNPYTGRDTPEHMQMLDWILNQIEYNPEIDYHLLNFVENDHYAGAEILLNHGANPNRWVRNWNSVWDLTTDKKMRALIESYGGKSNFRKLLFTAGLIFLLGFILIRKMLKPKQQLGSQNQAARPERNERKGKIYYALGALLFFGGVIGAMLLRYGSAVGMGRPDGAMIFYAIGLGLAGLGIKFITSGRKLQMRDAEDIVREATSNISSNTNHAVSKNEPLFLYLRSFKLDEQDKQNIVLPGGLSASINPWEGSLAAAFGKVGEMVAIGRPGEKLATTGAARLYVTDDQWQDKVLELIDKTDLVIWTFGDTEGLRWEISRLVKIVPPEKLVIAIPFWDKKMSVRKTIWESAQDMLNKTLSKPLPKEVSESLFIAFDKNWNAEWVETKTPAKWQLIAFLGFWNRITKGVRSLLLKRGYKYPKLTLVEKIAYASLSVLGWILVVTILVMFYALIQTLLR